MYQASAASLHIFLIIVFHQSGLFSASVTAFIIEAYKNLLPNSTDITVTLLSQISLQIAAGSNGSFVGPLTAPASFEPTSSALRVNAFWSISLILGLTSALGATLVQQWARAYFQTVERHRAPYKKGWSIECDYRKV